MPYVNQETRNRLDRAIDDLACLITSSGDANYIITSLLLNGRPSSNYEEYNSIIGILECAKLEFYRRAVASYEDQKREQNGDVFD